ncbi:MAG: phosphohydrolase, partial [Candidatus Taylorbacteria bacterium]|nr:phosphohydrolase [Candidatus Taylorbacteria bacterium]
MIFKAIEFSTKAHTGLYRKGTKIPYLTHPLN